MISYYILSAFSMMLYLHFFFPVGHQNHIEEHEPPNKLKDINFNIKEVYNASVDKMILIVIDALRHDFITYNNTPNLVKIIKTDGCSALVKVESPTVTLPRIKTLTAGNVPQFIDFILNILYAESATDSVIHQAVNNGKRIVFYGDDTWLKLFPRSFLRSEGTSSFYVYDYTEVDNNVTRNVRQELVRDDWDIMILHYLGLDHIGHITGPFSPLVQPKLEEMDRIIKDIYESTKNTKRSILITGDHGMKDSGGHGGTTYSETRVPFLLLGQPCKDDSLSQSDIPLIFSTLMGLPFPSNTIGKISSKLLSFLPLQKLLYSLRYNSLLLANKTAMCEGKIDRASDMHYNFLKRGYEPVAKEAIRLYENCLSDMSSQLLHQTTAEDNDHLILYVFVLICCLIASILLTLSGENTSKLQVLILLLICICSFYNWNWYFIAVFSLITIAFTTNYFLKLIKLSLFDIKINFKALILIVLNVVHGISMFSTSFIEEEHQTWYFFFTTFLLVNSIKNISTYTIITVLLFRIVRQINQTGDKWAAEPDISQWLLLEHNYFYYHALCLLSLAWTGFLSIKLFCKNKLNKIVTVIILILIYIFKMHTTNHLLLGQVIWSLIFINFVLALEISPISLINTWILIICLLYRPQNIILIPFCIYTSTILEQQIQSKLILTILHCWIGNALYFCQGHSNSLSSIDVGIGYVGLKHYKLVYVFLQVLCHTYSMPVLANLLLINHYNDLSVWKTLGILRLLVAAITFTVSYIHRHHLFIWSVFGPRLLLETSHTIVVLIQMLLHCGFVLMNNYLNKKFNF